MARKGGRGIHLTPTGKEAWPWSKSRTDTGDRGIFSRERENLRCSLQVLPHPPTAPAQRVPRDKAATEGLSHASRLFDPTAWRIPPRAVLDVSHPPESYL